MAGGGGAYLIAQMTVGQRLSKDSEGCTAELTAGHCAENG